MEKASRRRFLTAAALTAAVGLGKVVDAALTPLEASIVFLVEIVVYCGIILQWLLSVRQRMLPSSVRRYAVLSGLLMLLWFFLRDCRYRIAPVGSPIEYLLWYAYYIPQLMLPLMLFYAALHIGRRETWTLPTGWKLLYLPAAGLILAILTNNLHQLAFRFIDGSPDRYVYGPVYFAAAAWVGALLLASIVLCFVKSRLTAARQSAWKPLAVLAAYAVCLLYIRNGPWLLPRKPYLFPEASCFAVMAVWECCLRIQLIPSNTDYHYFFENAALSAQIADDAGRILYRAADALPITAEDMAGAARMPVLLRRDLRLSSHPIRGGRVYWTEDVSAMNRLNDELSAAIQTLSEENDLIAAENRLRRNQAHIREQTAIYERIAGELKPRLDRMQALLAEADPDSPAVRSALTRLCVYGAYIKRRANLLLLAAGAERIHKNELTLSLIESMTYLRQAGAACALTDRLAGTLPAGTLIGMYDFFQDAVEAAGTPRSLLIFLGRGAAGPFIRLTLETDAPLGPLPAGTRETDEDGVYYLTLTLPEGGEET